MQFICKKSCKITYVLTGYHAEGRLVYTMTENKDFYKVHADKIWDKRFNSPFPIRRYAHRAQYRLLLDEVLSGSILDAGCGEGIASIILAERGIASTGVDLSEPNIREAREQAENRKLSHLASFQTADIEALPFADRSFDTVISSHVLEHIPDFDKGFKGLCRIASKRVIVALPTCLNLCAAALLGGDHGFWKLSKRSIIALPWGIARIFGNIFSEGVQEGYAGKDDLPHIWRYPWVMRRRLKHPDYKMTKFCASTFVLPYANSTLPLVKRMEKYNYTPFLRNFGYGSYIVLDRITDK
ncbi:MAG: class I SAM-dependent methyltransferase [Patescibacteria group bacterium]